MTESNSELLEQRLRGLRPLSVDKSRDRFLYQLGQQEGSAHTRRYKMISIALASAAVFACVFAFMVSPGREWSGQPRQAKDWTSKNLTGSSLGLNEQASRLGAPQLESVKTSNSQDSRLSFGFSPIANMDRSSLEELNAIGVTFKVWQHPYQVSSPPRRWVVVEYSPKIASQPTDIVLTAHSTWPNEADGISVRSSTLLSGQKSARLELAADDQDSKWSEIVGTTWRRFPNGDSEAVGFKISWSRMIELLDNEK